MSGLLGLMDALVKWYMDDPEGAEEQLLKLGGEGLLNAVRRNAEIAQERDDKEAA